jgi:hypothetical protein
MNCPCYHCRETKMPLVRRIRYRLMAEIRYIMRSLL